MRDKLDWHVQPAIDAGQPEEPSARRGTTPTWNAGARRSRTSRTTRSRGPPRRVPVASAILDELYATWQAEGGLLPAHEAGFAVHDHPEIEHLVPDRIDRQALKVESFSARLFGLGSGHPLMVGADASRIAVASASHRAFRTPSDSVAIHVVVLPGRSAAEIASLVQDGPAFEADPTSAARVGGIDVSVGRLGDRWIIWWYRDARLAQILARSKKRGLAVVAPTDAAMTHDATVTPKPVTPEAAEDLQATIGGFLHHDDPALEELLPPPVGPVSAATSLMLAPETIEGMLGFGVPEGTMAWVDLASGCTARILRLPAADRDLLASVGLRLPGIPPASSREVREIGGRRVTWSASRSSIAAIWVRDDLLCCVAGRVTDAAIIEAIEQMP